MRAEGNNTQSLSHLWQTGTRNSSISTVVCVEEGPLDSTPASHRRKVSSQCLALLWRKMNIAHIQHLCVAHATIPSVSTTAHHQSGPFCGWYIHQTESCSVSESNNLAPLVQAQQHFHLIPDCEAIRDRFEPLFALFSRCHSIFDQNHCR